MTPPARRRLGKLQKRSHLLNYMYHICREAQASSVLNFAHIDGKDNPADIITKQESFIQGVVRSSQAFDFLHIQKRKSNTCTMYVHITNQQKNAT